MDEKNGRTPMPDSSDDSRGKNVNPFLDDASGDSVDDFLEQLYNDSFKDLTSEFDSLLKEYQNINPDDLAGETFEVQANPEQATETEPVSETEPLPKTQSAQEMEDIYSYSDPAQAAGRKTFSESVQEAMDAEQAQAQRAEAAADAFNLSLDELDDTQMNFADAVERAYDSDPMQHTQVYSVNSVRQAQQAGRQPHLPVQPERPRQPVQRPQQPRRPAQPGRTQMQGPAGKPTVGVKKTGSKKKKRSLLPQKNDSVFEVFRKVLFMVSVLVVVVCIGIIGNIYLLQPSLERRNQDKLQGLRSGSVSDAESFRAAYGDMKLPGSVTRYDLAQFYAENNDFYGYLEIPGTGLSTPVVQGKNNDEYLRKNFFGDKTKYGCPFVNAKNTNASYASLDDNTSIFGHNMEYDDLVFGELEKYRDIEAFKKAPIIRLETMYTEYTFKIYAVFLTDANRDSSGWFFNYIFTQLKDDNERAEYIEELDQRKLYSTGVDILPTDKLLTLSTCAYDFSSERLVVVGRLVREGESADVDVSKAVVKSSPRMPDRYYQKKGMANPFSGASKWIPNA